MFHRDGEKYHNNERGVIMKHIEEYIEILKKNKKLRDIIDELKGISETVKKTNDLLGYTERADDIRKEINENGWANICKKYHPDNNISDPAALPLFELYKFIYDSMNKNNK